jgi:hypothetical protein
MRHPKASWLQLGQLEHEALAVDSICNKGAAALGDENM